MEKLAGCQQSIEHLRVVQLNGAGETSLPNTPAFQIAQALTLLRELLAAVK